MRKRKKYIAAKSNRQVKLPARSHSDNGGIFGEKVIFSSRMYFNAKVRQKNQSGKVWCRGILISLVFVVKNMLKKFCKDWLLRNFFLNFARGIRNDGKLSFGEARPSNIG